MNSSQTDYTVLVYGFLWIPDIMSGHGYIVCMKQMAFTLADYPMRLLGSTYIYHWVWNFIYWINPSLLYVVAKWGYHSLELFSTHDDIIEWKHFPRYWPFVSRVQRSPVNSPHKGQWCRALMFSLICTWINSWVNNREAGDLRRHHARYDVIVMPILSSWIMPKKSYQRPLFF